MSVNVAIRVVFSARSPANIFAKFSAVALPDWNFVACDSGSTSSFASHFAPAATR